MALAHWRETGAAAELLETRDDGMTLLLDRLRPASTLDDVDYDRAEIAAASRELCA